MINSHFQALAHSGCSRALLAPNFLHLMLENGSKWVLCFPFATTQEESSDFKISLLALEKVAYSSNTTPTESFGNNYSKYPYGCHVDQRNQSTYMSLGAMVTKGWPILQIYYSFLYTKFVIFFYAPKWRHVDKYAYFSKFHDQFWSIRINFLKNLFWHVLIDFSSTYFSWF